MPRADVSLKTGITLIDKITRQHGASFSNVQSSMLSHCVTVLLVRYRQRILRSIREDWFFGSKSPIFRSIQHILSCKAFIGCFAAFSTSLWILNNVISIGLDGRTSFASSSPVHVR